MRAIPLAYLGAIIGGTICLWLPFSSQPGRNTSLMDAAFTSVSAICVTGLTTVDTATEWSHAGQVVILILIEMGGLGIVTLATLMVLLARGRISLKSSALTEQETHATSLADAWRLPRRIVTVMLSVQAVFAVALTLGFRGHLGSWGEAIWYGVFHAISAFNNAGFGLRSKNLMEFVGAPEIILPICAAIILGGIGFPVLAEIWRKRRQKRRSWSVHTRLTVSGTVILLVLGIGFFAVFEWNNPGTLGPLDLSEKIWGSVAGGVFPRTAGFNSVDNAHLNEPNIGLYYFLMLIGGGSGGTAGGLKVGTIAILWATVVAELRAEPQVVVGHRAIPYTVQRAAVTIMVLAIGVVAISTVFLLIDTDFTLQEVLFETTSAFGTVGASMGITPYLRNESKIVLMLLMFLGRVGIVTVATAFAVRQQRRRFSLPKESPLVG